MDVKQHFIIIIRRTQSSAAVRKSRWPSWAPVPNKPTVSVDVKQHFSDQPRCQSRYQTPSTGLRHPSSIHCHNWLRLASPWCSDGSMFVTTQTPSLISFIVPVDVSTMKEQPHRQLKLSQAAFPLRHLAMLTGAQIKQNSFESRLTIFLPAASTLCCFHSVSTQTSYG